MRIIFLLSFILLCDTGFSQKDSTATQKLDTISGEHKQTLKSKFKRLEQMEAVLDTARQTDDLYMEMTTLKRIVAFKTREFGDITSTYLDALYLEKLIDQNPNFIASKEISELLFHIIGWILQEQGNYKASIHYFNKSIEASKSNENKSLYFYSRVHLVQGFWKSDNKQKALNLHQEIKGDASKSKDSNQLSRLNESLSDLYLNDGDFNQSLRYGISSLYPKAPKNMLSNRNVLVARSYFNLNNPDSALVYAEEGLKIAGAYSLELQKSNAHEILKEIHSELGNHERAMYHFEQFYTLEQKQRSFDDALQIGNVNLEREKEASKLQQELAEERLSNQRLIIWIVSGGLLLLIIGLFYIFNQLKLIREQNKIIKQEKLRAEQSERYKEQFLANMSHEIRTPMNAISGMTNNLLRNPHPKIQDPYLEAMKTSSDNLLVLLNDILDLSKIESGKLEIEHELLNPTNVVKNVIQILHFKSSEKGLKLNSEIESTFPQEIIGDASRLTQILINLVGNAIKFTETGSITIKLSKIDDTIRFSIIDTGIGIDSEKLEMIFDNFEQGDSSKSQIYGGTGLGLSISKRLVELQNGKIWVESILGKGSTFIFELPLQQEISNKIDNKNLNKNDLQSICKELDGIRILIVDDDEFNIMIVKDDLNYFIENTTLSVAKNGKEAVELFEQNHFDIILMDMHMPIMNGCEATEIIRTLEKDTKNRTPIIAMTANIIKSEIDKCIASGMDAYIPKPYKPEELLIKIHEMVK